MSKTDTKKEPVTQQTDEKKTSRQQISKLIGINLSVSRVRKYVDKCNVNQDVESACTELKALLDLEKEGKIVDLKTLTKDTTDLINKAYSTIYDVRLERYNALKERLTKSKTASDKKRLKELEAFPVKEETLSEKIDYVSKLRCRFSNDASVVLSSALDYVVQDLVRSAMVNARQLGKAIIQVSHVVKGDFANLSVYPLVKQLKVIQDALSVGDQEADNEIEDETEEEENTSSTFEFYINLICKSVKSSLVASDEAYTPIRISKHIRKFCSDVVIQLIERMSPLIKLYAQTASVKTVNDDVIKFIFKFLLLDSGVDSSSFIQFMDERLAVYQNVKSTK